MKPWWKFWEKSKPRLEFAPIDAEVHEKIIRDVRALIDSVESLQARTADLSARVPFLDPDNMADAHDTRGVAVFINGLWSRLESLHKFAGSDAEREAYYDDLIVQFGSQVNILRRKALGRVNRQTAMVQVKGTEEVHSLDDPCVPVIKLDTQQAKKRGYHW